MPSRNPTWHRHGNAIIRMCRDGTSIADEVTVAYYNNCGESPSKEDALRTKMADRVANILNALDKDESGMPVLPKNLQDVIRKAKNWDDLQEVRRLSYATVDGSEPMWMRHARAGQIDEAIKSHRVLCGTSLVESRDVVQHFINRERNNGDDTLSGVLDRQ